MTKDEVAALLNVSPRQVERLVKAGRLYVSAYERGTTRKVPAYDRAEVEALQADLAAPTHQAHPAGETAEARGVAIATRADNGDAGMSQLVAIMRAALEHSRERNHIAPVEMVSVADKLVLNLAEVAMLTGRSVANLRADCTTGKLKATKDEIARGWRVKRADLDRYVTKL
jgi:excisionase family DNA binding protein